MYKRLREIDGISPATIARLAQEKIHTCLELADWIDAPGSSGLTGIYKLAKIPRVGPEAIKKLDAALAEVGVDLTR